MCGQEVCLIAIRSLSNTDEDGECHVIAVYQNGKRPEINDFQVLMDLRNCFRHVGPTPVFTQIGKKIGRGMAEKIYIVIEYFREPIQSAVNKVLINFAN